MPGYLIKTTLLASMVEQIQSNLGSREIYRKGTYVTNNLNIDRTMTQKHEVLILHVLIHLGSRFLENCKNWAKMNHFFTIVLCGGYIQ